VTLLTLDNSKRIDEPVTVKKQLSEAASSYLKFGFFKVAYLFEMDSKYR